MFREITRRNKDLGRDAAIELLKSELRGVLSLIGDDGYPYGVPMDHYYCEEDGCIYFHSGMAGHKVDAMKRCDKASYCVIDSGSREDGNWYLMFKSAIVFGRIEIVSDAVKLRDIAYRLSRKFTDDEEYIKDEIAKFEKATLLFALRPEHITCKSVKES